MMTKADFYLHDLVSKFKKIDPKKYYLAYSGGKDSGMLFWFLRTWLKTNYPEMYEEYKVIPAVSVNTRLEWPEIVERMQLNADVILVPKLFPYQVIEKVGTPCFSKNADDIIGRYQRGSRSESVMMYVDGTRNGGETMFCLNNQAKEMLVANQLPRISNLCCNELKKKPVHEFEKSGSLHSIMGIMASESMMRKSRYKSCFTKDLKFTPLWDCTEETMNEIYEQYQIPLPKIYKYMNQTGCAGCPYGIGLGHTAIELQLMTPAKRRYVERCFGKAYSIRLSYYKSIPINQPIETLVQTSIYDESTKRGEEKE